MDAITYFGGKKYLHSDYNTPAKQKNLPEQVIKAIQGDVQENPESVDATTSVEQTPIEPTTPVEDSTGVEATQVDATPGEQTVTNETNNN
jgi:hypothetical protein